MRKGLTLIELMVVIAIIGIVLGLTLVAVQMARESARRSQCSNNFRQIGIALLNYHELLGSLPPAVIWAPYGEPLGEGLLPIGIIDRVAKTGQISNDTIYANWLIMLLPQLEQTMRYDSTKPVSAPSNATLRSTRLQVVLCPSDANNDEPFERGLALGLTDNLYARGNVAINVGPDGNCAGPGTTNEPCVNGFFVSGLDFKKNNAQVWGSGIAGVNKSFNLSAVTDGASNTIAIDEIRAGLDPLDPRGAWALGQVGSSVIARHGIFSASGHPNPCDGAEEFIACGALTEKMEGRLKSECMTCRQALASGELNVKGAARSMHPGGVNVLALDGAVHFVNDSIDPTLWHALHTRDGGETMGW